MKARSAITAVLLLFVGISVLYVVFNERRSRTTGGKTDGPVTSLGKTPGLATTGGETGDGSAPGRDAAPGGSAHQVVAYYFHGNTRCWTCRTIEAYTEEALKTGFADDLSARKLVWLVVNIEEPDNEHFVEDYKLVTRSLVLTEMENGTEKRWKTLDKTWQLVHDKDAFNAYVTENTRAFLAGN